MEFLQKLGPIDLFIVASLAAGVFAGFMGGMVRYALNIVVVIVAFIIAGQLRGPFDSILQGWNVFGPEMREQLVFLILFVGLTVGGWFLVRIFWKGTRLPIAKQLDDPCRQAVGGVRWYKEAAPAVADHLAAAWHVRRHDREPG